MSDAGSAPTPPPPEQTAAAQENLNRNTALYNTQLNRYDEVTPLGKRTWQVDPNSGPQYNMDAYNKAMQVWAAAPNTADQVTWDSENGVYRTTPGKQAIAPKLEDFKYGDSAPRYTSKVELDPRMQQAFDNFMSNSAQMSKLSGNYLNQIGQTANTPFSLDGVPQMLDIPQADDASRRRVEEALLSRLEPQYQRQEEQLRSRLANQGITQGSEAFNRDIDEINRARNDARMQSVLAGGQEQSRLFDLGARQYGMGAQAHQQGIADLLLQRSQPLNEYNALRSASQLQLPQFGQGAQAPAMGAPNMGQYQQNQYDALMNIYNGNVASDNANTSAAAGLGSAALMAIAMSDRRLKEDIKPVGKLDNGLPLYRFRYIGNPEVHIGCMADEVEAVIPDAVMEDARGFKMVDYAKVIAHVQLRS